MEPPWIELIQNIGWPGVTALVLWRFGVWIDPKLTMLIEAHASFLKHLGEQMTAQTSRLDRHSDLLKEMAPQVRDIHAHIVPTRAGRDEETEKSFENAAARRSARAAPA